LIYVIVEQGAWNFCKFEYFGGRGKVSWLATWTTVDEEDIPMDNSRVKSYRILLIQAAHLKQEFTSSS
jgi:hypothetical protein